MRFDTDHPRRCRRTSTVSGIDARQASSPKRQRALPTGGVDVVFNLGDGAMRVFADASDCVGESFERAVMHGAHSRYFVLDAHAATSMWWAFTFAQAAPPYSVCMGTN